MNTDAIIKAKEIEAKLLDAQLDLMNITDGLLQAIQEYRDSLQKIVDKYGDEYER